jgi:hypothetical protein
VVAENRKRGHTPSSFDEARITWISKADRERR